MIVARSIPALRAALAGGSGVGLVPTMGAFHAGHLSLFEAARAESEVVVVSLFVNPAQFEDGADLARYPRDERADLALAAQAGVDVAFLPSSEEIYPEGFSTWVDPGPLGEVLEGAARPGHFRGVATVVLRLLLLVRPERAYFGAKDAQQAAVVRRLVRDLELGIEIRVLETVRDRDGLALSSRNRLLSPAGREQALELKRALDLGAAAHALGGDAALVARAALGEIESDYVEVAALDGVVVLAAAVRVEGVRLIDNVVLSGGW